jgi:hypothetical protein
MWGHGQRREGGGWMPLGGEEEEEGAHRASARGQMGKSQNGVEVAEISIATSAMPFSSLVANADGVLPRASPHSLWPPPG